MAIQWSNYHIRQINSGLYLGFGETKPNGTIKWHSRSDNRTEEIVRATAALLKYKMEKKNNPDKPYAGYRMEDDGQLVYIKNGFEFSIRPAPRKRQKIRKTK